MFIGRLRRTESSFAELELCGSIHCGVTVFEAELSYSLQRLIENDFARKRERQLDRIVKLKSHHYALMLIERGWKSPAENRTSYQWEQKPNHDLGTYETNQTCGEFLPSGVC